MLHCGENVAFLPRCGEAGARSSVHAGGNGQFYALVAIQPERDRAVAFLINDLEGPGSATGTPLRRLW